MTGLTKPTSKKMKLFGFLTRSPMLSVTTRTHLRKIRHSSVNDNVHTAADSLWLGYPVEMVIGDRLSSADFFALATLKQDFPEKLHVFKMLDNASPENHSACIGRNLYFEDKNYTGSDGRQDYGYAQCMEYASPEVIARYHKLFENYKARTKEVSADELFARAQQKKAEELSKKSRSSALSL